MSKTDITASIRHKSIVIENKSNRRSKNNKLKSICNVDVETAPESDNQSDGDKSDRVLTFPKIGGDKKIKDIKLALLNDLVANNIIKRDVPFSSIRKMDIKKSINTNISLDTISSNLKDAV